MPIRDLKAQISRLPEQPGVYLYYNRAGETLYVGKAKVLRDRVRSYLGAQGMSPRIDALLAEAQRLEFIVTDSVVEALALENHLIKQRGPKYNILLRDDKNYPYLQLTVGEGYPRVLVARHVERDAHFYAGPYLPASLARRTMSLSHKLFGIRSCNEVITGERGRPCLEFDIKRCVAPCVREICSEDQYRVAVEDTRLFLEGRNQELLVTLKARMTEAATAELFEQAAQLRDAIRTIETLATRQQKMATVGSEDRDAFGIKAGPPGAVVQVFQVRGGRVVERIELVTEDADPSNVAEADILQAALQQFYADRVAPPEIHLPVEFSDSDAEVLEGWLSAAAQRRVRICVPKRGDKRGLLDLAARNAAVGYQARFNANVAANYDALETLRAVLSLPSIPRRIECFDISTIQGSETVASMVVCEDGRMKKAEYRKFKIRGTESGRAARLPLALMAPAAAASRESSSSGAAASGGGAPLALISDDFKSMHEVVLRRYRKLLEQGGPFPDLVLIDGGKGQLAAAYGALEELGLANLMAVGIAKKEEILFTRQYVDGIALPKESPALLLIQRIRDEAHRFAVTFHRASRTRRDLTSELDGIPGVGPRRRKSMLMAFGSLAGVRRATREDLVRIVGTKCAEAVLGYFAGGVRPLKGPDPVEDKS
ncbi:MAG: excinuclease ABC subunit UvrC [Vicinamibacterales bacterium]